MRAKGKDIVEIFGYRPDDISPISLSFHENNKCPFVKEDCSKKNSDQTITYGVCSLTDGAKKEIGSEIIACPKRLYADDFKVLKNASEEIWGKLPFIIGGSKEELRIKALQFGESVIAFGQGSGNEIGVSGDVRLSMDWVLQRYTYDGNKLIAQDFVGIEIQSIDITGNYRDCHNAYSKTRYQSDQEIKIPNSGHGLNWANVHKRLMPQIIRKGNIYKDISRCKGFFFILPDSVFKRFESLLGHIDDIEHSANDILTIHTYKLGKEVPYGNIRDIEIERKISYTLLSVYEAFSQNSSERASEVLDNNLKNYFN